MSRFLSMFSTRILFLSMLLASLSNASEFRDIQPKKAGGREPLPDSTIFTEVLPDGKKVPVTLGELKERLKSNPEKITGRIIEDEEILSPNPSRREYLDVEIDRLQSDAEHKKAYDDAMKIIPGGKEVNFSQAVFRDKKKAEAFLNQLQENSGNFEETLKMAQEKDPEVKGGDVDFTTLGELPPALSAAVGHSKNNEIINKVVEERLGASSIYFVVKVKEIRDVK